MATNAYKLSTSSHSTITRTLEIVHSSEKIKQERMLPAPPSEETVARLNAIGREYPFCAYIKQNNLFWL